MGVQSQPESRLATKERAGKGTSEKERDCSHVLLPTTGQGRMIALGVRDEMNGTNILYPWLGPETPGKQEQRASFRSHITLELLC